MPAPSPRRALLLAAFALFSADCGDDSPTSQPPAPQPPASQPPASQLSDFEAAGPYPVGNVTVTLDDAARGRTLRAELWYPAAEGARAGAEAGFPVEEFAPAGAERAQLAALVAAAPDPATSRRAHAARDAEPGGVSPWPVVAFSHCYNCTRFSTFAIAERLASHGVAVIAPDHAGGTLADQLAGAAAPLDASFLEVRAGDIAFALDRALDGAAAELPAALRGRFDSERVGVFGHSFGGVTAGLVLMRDARPRAGLALAVPMENPLLPGVAVKSIRVPLFFLVAAEDNSIGELGNGLIRLNYDDANPPVWKAEVKDAGHWSFTNICGLVPDFDAGCSNDVRQTNGEPFTYVDVDAARGVAAAYTTAFFAATLRDDPVGREYLAGARPEPLIDAKSRSE
jgi:dienelactone hydrolase